jgi:hypothetical protein
VLALSKVVEGCHITLAGASQYTGSQYRLGMKAIPARQADLQAALSERSLACRSLFDHLPNLLQFLQQNFHEKQLSFGLAQNLVHRLLPVVQLDISLVSQLLDPAFMAVDLVRQGSPLRRLCIQPTD